MFDVDARKVNRTVCTVVLRVVVVQDMHGMLRYLRTCLLMLMLAGRVSVLVGTLRAPRWAKHPAAMGLKKLACSTSDRTVFEDECNSHSCAMFLSQCEASACC